LFSVGATLAVSGMLFFIALYPRFTSEIFHIYWWPLLGELVTFGLQIFFLYTYWFSWDRIRPIWHQFLGYGYAVVVFFQTLLINTLASGMLTIPLAREQKYSCSGWACLSHAHSSRPDFCRLVYHTSPDTNDLLVHVQGNC
jgi:cytochrome bd-type quinol oxidase subunit 1